MVFELEPHIKVLSAHDLSRQGVWRWAHAVGDITASRKQLMWGCHTPYFRISVQLNKPEVSASESLITVLHIPPSLFFHPNTKWVLH